MDPLTRRQFWDLIYEAAHEGVTLMVTTHYMEEAEELCDRVALMHHGELRAVGEPSALAAELGPEVTLEDVFRHYTGDDLDRKSTRLNSSH